MSNSLVRGVDYFYEGEEIKTMTTPKSVRVFVEDRSKSIGAAVDCGLQRTDDVVEVGGYRCVVFCADSDQDAEAFIALSHGNWYASIEGADNA